MLTVARSVPKPISATWSPEFPSRIIIDYVVDSVEDAKLLPLELTNTTTTIAWEHPTSPSKLKKYDVYLSGEKLFTDKPLQNRMLIDKLIPDRKNEIKYKDDKKQETCDNTEILLPSYDAVHIRPEMSSLPPIMLMPSLDPELLLRQLRLQRMQEKVLRAQFNSLRLPIARYEEIDPDGGHVELLVEGDEEFIGERVDDEQELNVTNSGDESGDEIMRESPT
ncbi:hypothetical protein NECAME_12559 [Necator americanus]|uniref:Fibronectin type III domain protein n=1 Tax=Necator americanus TaxID=51031 RepID=W2T0D4_NECAM|nr:hypothetical protein NECAME_12559 [Necator americanus]ETN75024.1 hypothetical protein NECAME_12559 [Necator americanus]